MGYIARHIDAHLERWRTAGFRKTLLLRGARQVGKTSSVRELGRRFKYYLEVNLLDKKRALSIFQSGDFDPQRICSELSALFSVPIIDGETLLFLDEVQACPEVIESLRFFYEKRPGLHVIAAGSLLEFALEKLPSFGVGRVESLYMRPVTFSEFLEAGSRRALAEAIAMATPTTPLPESLHAEALSLLKTYLILGGLPEVVTTYLQEPDFLTSARVLSSVFEGYEDDFIKYRGKVPLIRLSDTLRAVAQQTGSKFVYKHAYLDAVSQQVHQALRLLELAGLVVRVVHSSANGIPLGAEANPARFKALIFDVAVHQRLLGLSARELIGSEYSALVHRGSLAEALVGMELLGYADPFERSSLWYWHRESKNSNAEIDYVLQHGSRIVPIEVKSNVRGSMTSMRIFTAEKKSEIGLRISAENFGRVGNVLIVPLYAIKELPRIIDLA